MLTSTFLNKSKKIKNYEIKNNILQFQIQKRHFENVVFYKDFKIEQAHVLSGAICKTC